MNNSTINRFLKQLTPLFIAMVSFFILVFGTLSYLNYQKDIWEKDLKTRLYQILMTKKTNLEKTLYSRIYYTRSLAAFVSQNPQITNLEFSQLTEELIHEDSIISTMSLSRNCVISAIYPEKGHEAAIGLDLLSHPERREIVEKTIETHKTFIAGPVELVEGGIAFISYTPIFDKITRQEETFWGVTDIVIYQDRLLEQASLQTLESGFKFALRGFNGQGNEGAIWWGDPDVFDQNPVTVNIDLPDGSWVLAAVPEIGWSSYYNQDNVLLVLLISSSFIISILIWLFSNSMVKIRKNEQELNAIFKSMNSLIIEFDHEGRYKKIPPVNAALLVRPREQLLNKTVFEVFPPEMARLFHQKILECLKSTKLVEFEYPLQIEGRDIWFSARISWKSEYRVIYHAFDITDQKNARERIIQSERNLKDLNATKDKFFSIVAHDLKSPFNVILGFGELLRLQYDHYDEIEKKELIRDINDAAKSAFNLLENLLLWANAQSNKVRMINESVNLHELVTESIVVYIPGAENKLITTEVTIPTNLSVFVDKFTIQTVIGNLYNNAVKFTHKGGLIKIDAYQTENSEFVEVCIADNGVGIPSELLPQLFLIEASKSTAGTENEKGTGLGLLLCKEFVEKHGGTIWAESKTDGSPNDRGSKFHFTIPKG
jgi:PAS domain S-box-containing protein